MQILCDKDPLDVYKEAATIAYKAVAHTLGPGGTNTAVVNKRGAHDIINDGYTILSKLTDLDPAVSEALETIKLASFETNRKAGDGCQPLDNKILTPDGWKRFGDIKVGDIVCGTDRTKQMVIGVFPQGKLRKYKVYFDDGSIIECSKGHLWSVYDTSGRVKGRNLLLEELIDIGVKKEKKGFNSYRFYTPKTTVDFNKKDLVISPFILGVLLGDGCFSEKADYIEFSLGYEKVPKIIDRFKEELPEGFTLQEYHCSKRHCVRYRIKGSYCGKNFKDYIKGLGLLDKHSEDKFIPDSYLYNSFDNRSALLSGLILTDGHLNKRGLFEYSSVSEILINNIRELALSLGISVKLRVYTNRKRSFGDKPLYRLVQRKGYTYGDKIIKIEDTGEDVDMMCIKVSNENELYITEDYKVTHNTTSTTILTYNLLLGAIDYLKATNKPKVELRNLLLDYRDDIIDSLHQTQSREITDSEYEAISKVSLGSSKYAKLISNAYRFLPIGLRPSVVRADIPEVISEEKDGIVLDKAECIVSPDLLEKGAKELNDVDVYCIYDKLDRWQQIQPIIEQIIRLKRQAILFYNELSMDILQNIQLQIVKGYADIIPIRLGSMGIQTKSTLTQVSKYTNATLIDGQEVRLPRNMKDIQIGKLDYILISTDTVIINNKDFTDLDSITLPTKSVIIRTGGINVSDMEENYRRIEDAVNSLGNAIDSGISVGAGITYQRLALTFSDAPKFITNSLNSIYERVIYNITGNPKIPEDIDGLVPNKSGEFELADELQIFDATKVVEQVIINSFTLVSQIITTQVIIAESVR